MGKMENKKAPGIFLWNEFLPAFEEMDPQSVKEIIVSAMKYGNGDEVQDPAGTECRIVWTLLKSKLDVNQKHYSKTCENRAYGRYCQSMKDNGKEPLSREEWDERRRKE